MCLVLSLIKISLFFVPSAIVVLFWLITALQNDINHKK